MTRKIFYDFKKSVELKNLVFEEWGEEVELINAHQNYRQIACKLTNKLLKIDYLTTEITQVITALFEHNNIIFYQGADYNQYQKISAHVLRLLAENALNLKKEEELYLLVLLVYSDTIFNDKKYSIFFQKSLNRNLTVLKNIKLTKRFLIHIHLSQYFLFSGSIKKSKAELEEAKKILSEIHIKNYILFFYYHYSWSFFEERDYKKAYKNALVLIGNQNQTVNTPIFLNSINLISKILVKLGKWQGAKNYATTCYKGVISLFGKTNCSLLAETLLTIGHCEFKDKKYTKSKKNIKKAIVLLERAFGSSAIDPSQAVAQALLGDLYVEMGKGKEACQLYKESVRIYKKLYGTEIADMPEAKALLTKIKDCP